MLSVVRFNVTHSGIKDPSLFFCSLIRPLFLSHLPIHLIPYPSPRLSPSSVCPQLTHYSPPVLLFSCFRPHAMFCLPFPLLSFQLRQFLLCVSTTFSFYPSLRLSLSGPPPLHIIFVTPSSHSHSSSLLYLSWHLSVHSSLLLSVLCLIHPCFTPHLSFDFLCPCSLWLSSYPNFMWLSALFLSLLLMSFHR